MSDQQNPASTPQNTDQDPQAAAPVGQSQTAAPQTPGFSTSPPSAPTLAVVKQKNVIGLVALIIAVVGFVFACIPGALIAGWVLLPVAFILSIVGLVLRDKRKAFALAALIVSVVGTIVGIVVFLAVVASSFQSAFAGSDSSVLPPAKSSSAATADAGSTAKVGTRDNPAAIGSTVKGSDYTVVINSVTLGATDQVMAANQFNDSPPAGSSYAVINATITYTGKDSGYAAIVGIDYVTASGNVITSADTLAVGPDPTLGLDELYTGASATGNVVLAIPDGDAGLLRVRPGLLDSNVFVATK